MEKDLYINYKRKKAEMVILISDKTGFKTKNTPKDKEEHFIRKTEQL